MTAKRKYIKQLHKKRVLHCTCGRFVSTRKSQFTNFDIASGSFLFTIVAVALLIKAPAAFAIILLPMLVIPWTIFLVAALAKGHSSKCAARWASIVILGAIGGFWL